MATIYCLGDAAAKRAAFKDAESGNAVYADNEEVLFSTKIDEKTYFAIGSIPYGDMTIAEYVAYKRAPERQTRNGEIGYWVKLYGLKSIRTRLAKLDAIGFRLAQVLAKQTADTAAVYLNFDGLGYSRGKRRALYGMLRRLSGYFSDVYVGVSDSRFVPREARVRSYSADGGVCEIDTRIRTRRIKKRTLKERYDGGEIEGLQMRKLLVSSDGERK